MGTCKHKSLVLLDTQDLLGLLFIQRTIIPICRPYYLERNNKTELKMDVNWYRTFGIDFFNNDNKCFNHRTSCLTEDENKKRLPTKPIRNAG